MKQGKIPSTWVTKREGSDDSEDLRQSEVASQWTRVKAVHSMKTLAV